MLPAKKTKKSAGTTQWVAAIAVFCVGAGILYVASAGLSRSSSSLSESPALAVNGWEFSDEGKIVNGKPRSTEGKAHFKHSQPLKEGDIWRMRVDKGRNVMVGFAGKQFDVKKHSETWLNTAHVYLLSGTTVIKSELSFDRLRHYNINELGNLIPDDTSPLDLALRITKDGNVPQIQFNDDDVWHDFDPDRHALKAGPWFPYLMLTEWDYLSDHHVQRADA